jgi:FecR protein
MMNLLRILILVAVAALMAAPPVSASADKAGDVVSLRGKAVITRETKGNISAAPKTLLLESDQVVTLERSRMKMLFRDDSVLTLGANSKLIIRKYLYNPENKRHESIYELADGKLRAVVGGKEFKVTTPTALAAARGTVFITWYDGGKTRTGVAVIEGSVLVQSNDDTVKGSRTLTAGQMVFVSAHQPPGKPVPIPFQSTIGLTSEDAGIIAEVSGDAPPDPVVPQPVFGGRAIRDVVRLIPVAPPIYQIPRSNVTTVNLNLQFP